jgi:RNA recognition motif-containing protein
MNIFVKNLASATTESDLQTMFGAFGAVRSSAVIKDQDTGASRGFGYVEMPDEAEAAAAIERLNGQEVGDRALLVRKARSLAERIEKAYRRAERDAGSAL